MSKGLKAGVLDWFYAHYQRTDESPGKGFDALLTMTGWAIGSDRAAGIQRRLSTLRLPLDPLKMDDPPVIELLIVTTRKDFPTLGACVAFALANSRNPVSRVVVVTPQRDVEGARRIVAPMSESVPLEVLDESTLLDHETATDLKRHFGDRFGWILQQFLCLAYVSASSAAGVLILDSDTWLIRPRLFLGDGIQILTPSLERHPPYYQFLRGLSPIYGAEQLTFVSHHMLWQPDSLRLILERVCDGSLTELARAVIARADMREPSPLCVKYEFYAHGLLALKPESVALAKWANSSAPRSQMRGPDPTMAIRQRYAKFASVSLHDFI